MDEDAAAGLIGLLVGGGFFLGMMVFVAIMLVGNWVLFTKAGKPGWAAIIPFYNAWVMVVEILGKPWFWFVGLFIPFVNFVVMILLSISLARVFGRGIAFALGLIFLGPIFLLILAFGSAKYLGPDEPGVVL